VLDPETGDLRLLDTASRAVRAAYAAAARQREERLLNGLRRLKVDTLRLSTDRPFIDDVRKLFIQRQRRASRS
jgi:uncharacterized protein (DUF58 family)